MLLIESLPAEVRLAYTSLQAENARLTQIIKLQDEEIRLLPLEISVTPAEIEREAARPEKDKALPLQPKAKTPRANHPGRASLPAHLERREEILPCHPQDCRCP